MFHRAASVTCCQEEVQQRKDKGPLNFVAMETTGDFGECRFRATEGAPGGKEKETASEDQVPMGGFGDTY